MRDMASFSDIFLHIGSNSTVAKYSKQRVFSLFHVTEVIG